MHKSTIFWLVCPLVEGSSPEAVAKTFKPSCGCSTHRGTYNHSYLISFVEVTKHGSRPSAVTRRTGRCGESIKELTQNEKTNILNRATIKCLVWRERERQKVRTHELKHAESNVKRIIEYTLLVFARYMYVPYTYV